MMKEYKIKKVFVILVMLLSIITMILLFEGINYIFSVAKHDLAYWIFLFIGVVLIILVGINEFYVVVTIKNNNISKRSLLGYRIVKFNEVKKIRIFKVFKFFILCDISKYPLFVSNLLKEYNEIVSTVHKKIDKK